MKIKCLIAVTTLTLVVGIAFAGFVQPASVIVDLDNQFASGDMWTARTAKDDDVGIGCGVRQFDDGTDSFSFGFCQAEDSDGNSIACFTQNAALLETMRATSAFAFITFQWTGDNMDVPRTQNIIRSRATPPERSSMTRMRLTRARNPLNATMIGRTRI